MKRFAAMFVTAIGALFLSCSSPEDDFVSDMERMASVLENVKDEASAKAAEPELRNLSKKMEQGPQDLDVTKLSADQKRRVEAATNNIDRQITRIMATAWGRNLDGTLGSMR